MKEKIVSLVTKERAFVTDGSTGSHSPVRLLDFQLRSLGLNSLLSRKICESEPDCETLSDLLEVLE